MCFSGSWGWGRSCKKRQTTRLRVAPHPRTKTDQPTEAKNECCVMFLYVLTLFLWLNVIPCCRLWMGTAPWLGCRFTRPCLCRFRRCCCCNCCIWISCCWKASCLFPNCCCCERQTTSKYVKQQNKGTRGKDLVSSGMEREGLKRHSLAFISLQPCPGHV